MALTLLSASACSASALWILLTEALAHHNLNISRKTWKSEVPDSSIFIHVHPLSSVSIHFHSPPSTFIHLIYFYPLSPTFINFHQLSSIFAHFYQFSSTIIHLSPLSSIHPLLSISSNFIHCSSIVTHFLPLSFISFTFIHFQLAWPYMYCINVFVYMC